MKFFATTIGITALVMTLGAPAKADPKPVGAAVPGAQTLANIYAGRTVPWKDCKGGIYFGGGWQAQAYCNRKGPAVGLGEWSVTRTGRVCYDLGWYWPTGDGVGSKPKEKECMAHLIDASGRLWVNWEKDNEWWGMDQSKNKGFKLKGKVTRLRRKLSL